MIGKCGHVLEFVAKRYNDDDGEVYRKMHCRLCDTYEYTVESSIPFEAIRADWDKSKEWGNSR